MHKAKVILLLLMSVLMFGCSSNTQTGNESEISKDKVNAFLSYTYEEAKKFISYDDGSVKWVDDQVIVVLRGDKSFGHDSSEVRDESREVLERLATLLMDHPQSKIFIAGHTDSVGAELYNKDLSERRATSVSEFFISQGVDTKRIGTFGFGEMIPIAGNDSADGRRENRRIEVRITPKFELFVG